MNIYVSTVTYVDKNDPIEIAYRYSKSTDFIPEKQTNPWGFFCGTSPQCYIASDSSNAVYDGQDLLPIDVLT